MVQEGIDPSKIVVVGNVIVDVIIENEKKFHKPSMEWLPNTSEKFALMTLHRDEHMRNPKLTQNIINQVGNATRKKKLPVILIEMPRLKSLNLKYPNHFVIIPPLGYFEFGWLEKNATIEFTDSGTNQESASIFGTPCVVTRDCTERPECRDSGTTVLSGYHDIEKAADIVLKARRNPNFSLGDGRSSQRIVDDLVERLNVGFIKNIEWHPKFDFKDKHSRIL